MINFFKHFWPFLLRPAVDGDSENDPAFLSVFVTPLLKARRGEKVKSFYSEAEFEEWKQNVGSDYPKFKIKYYKGEKVTALSSFDVSDSGSLFLS